MLTYAKGQETTFYEDVCSQSDLDLRDNRGKVHDLPFVLLGLLIGLLRYRDGTLSSIHRSLSNNHSKLCNALGVDIEPIISRSHLPRLLKKVNLPIFERLIFAHFEVELNDRQKQWFAGDGKELRGSIEKGNKRGEVLVQLVRHQDRAVLGRAYYNGTKDSEKSCLQQLITQKGAASQKISADALHLCPAMTEPIEQANGVFLIGLKDNQKDLLQDMKDHVDRFGPVNKKVTVDKGHGRLEKRTYSHYDVSEEYFESRWSRTNFRSLFVVQRSRIELKTNKVSEETSFYISNGKAQDEHQYFEAIRKHWSVEVNHHIRDVSLKEDQMRTKKTEITTVMAGLRTVVIALFGQWKPPNIVEKMQLFQDDFDQLIFELRQIRFL